MKTSLCSFPKAFLLTLFTLSNIALAQPRIPPVPDAVKMQRPTDAEVSAVQQALTNFKASLDSNTKQLLDKYPYLLEVRAPAGFNSALFPNLNVGFLAKHQNNLGVAKAGNIDVLFMGDSITDFWRNETGPFAGKPVLDKYFGSMKIANFGIAGDTTQGVLYRLQNGEGQGYNPKAIMLMIGTNNTASNNAPEIAEGIGGIVLELQKDFPTAKILLLGIFPRGKANDPVRDEIAQINSTIAKLHDGDRVHYMDISHIFVDADGNIPTDIMSDGLHPSAKGYELWAQAVQKQLQTLAQ